MIIITGIGWITPREYGAKIQKLQQKYENTKSLYAQLKDESVFCYPIKNFGRFDAASKMTCCAVGLALFDAGISYCQEEKQDIGIIGTNANGALLSNLNYFKDYIENGRTLSRGNLFIYTLPSSPLAEAAIYFKCQGPLLYVSFQHKQLSSLLACAGDMIQGGEIPRMLAVRFNEKEAICFVLAHEGSQSGRKVCSLDSAIAIAEGKFQPDATIHDICRLFPEDAYEKRRE